MLHSTGEAEASAPSASKFPARDPKWGYDELAKMYDAIYEWAGSVVQQHIKELKYTEQALKKMVEANMCLQDRVNELKAQVERKAGQHHMRSPVEGERGQGLWRTCVVAKDLRKTINATWSEDCVLKSAGEGLPSEVEGWRLVMVNNKPIRSLAELQEAEANQSRLVLKFERL
eukprot:Sspe_Gene.97704::Locus_71252_Transcript_1_1_Confidence_1.000_Length_742::g.97704::m.97704